MAIAYRGGTAAVYSAATFSPAIDAAQDVGDMMLLVVTGKPFNASWSETTSGWTALGRGESGTTAAGIDTGSMALQVWYKEATLATETAPTVTEGATTWSVVGGMVFVFSKDVSEVWEIPTVVYGADEVSGTAVSATMSANNNVDTNDMVLALLGANTDALGPFTTDVAATQTGVTFGGFTMRNDNESITGGDMAFNASTSLVTAGPSSAAAVLTATGTASGAADRCELGYVRLRASTPPATPYALFIQADQALYPGPSNN